VDTGPPKEKEIIPLAILGLNDNFGWLQKRVSLFNKTNPDYTIEVIDYWHYDEETARKRFTIVKVYIQYEAGSTNEERSYLYLCD